MKTKILLLFAWLMATATGCSADESRKDLSDMPPAEKLEEPVAPAGNRKAQIVYFSHTGNTRTIAGYIHDMVKSDMMELETEDTYTDITIRCWRKSVRRSQMSIVRRLRHAAKHAGYGQTICSDLVRFQRNMRNESARPVAKRRGC